MSEIIFLRCDGNNKDFIENCRLLDEDFGFASWKSD